MNGAVVTKMKLDRLKRGLTQTGVGKHIGCSGNYIRLIELGERNPRERIAKELEDFFGASIEELVKEV